MNERSETAELIKKVEESLNAAEGSINVPTAEQEFNKEEKHPTVQYGEQLASHLETVMAEYAKRVAAAAQLIRRTAKQLAEDQRAIERHLDAIHSAATDISKVGNHQER